MEMPWFIPHQSTATLLACQQHKLARSTMHMEARIKPNWMAELPKPPQPSSPLT